jgi:hypothetical protein
MKIVTVLSLLLSLSLTGAAIADTPDPSNSQTTLDSTQRLLICPDFPSPWPPATFTVTVRNSANNPIVGCQVMIVVGGQAANRTKLCPLAITNGVTTGQGVTFNIAGGGCMKGPGACEIWARETTAPFAWVMIRSFNSVMSPDYVGCDNVGQPGLWSLTVGLADFSQFACGFTTCASTCHDYNNNGNPPGIACPDLADFAAFVPAFGNFCH